MNKNNVFLWSIVIALGGFLFGFDTAVISGAEQSIQKYWNLNTVQHGLTVSIALIGTIIGALLGSLPSDKFGRKKTLYIIAFLYLLSSLGTAFSTDWYGFLVFRLLGGLGVGASSVTAPIYISEIAPAERRGKLVGLFQFNVVFGIVISYLSNYLIGLMGEHSWRLMLGIQAIPSAIFFLLLRFIPESPRWLIMKKGKIEEARDIFKIIDPKTADRIVAEISATDKEEKEVLQQDPLFSKRYKTPVMLSILLAVFNQVSGINAIIYYSPRIFEMTGLGSSSSLLSTVGLGIINFTFTLLAMNFIDRIGRKTLMLIGSFGLIFTLAMVSYSFYAESFNGWSVPVFLFIYIAFFAFSQGAVIWVFISEIFPNKVRAMGQSFGASTHWVFAALITLLTPVFLDANEGIFKDNPWPIFAFFAFMMALQLVWVLTKVPETKGVSLEELEKKLVR